VARLAEGFPEFKLTALAAVDELAALAARVVPQLTHDSGRDLIAAVRAGYLNLYVADSGVMDKPTPDYPLLLEGTADVFTGVPIGITQRAVTWC
jgi:S-DNA-T family DNA segregation ATPase FtsK/SpoIIIE